MPRARGTTKGSKTAQAAKSITHLQSLNLIRNLIRVSVSEICYLRNLFPEELFKERVYADMRVKCLAPTTDMDSKDAKDAALVTQWLEDGVFEALEKKYLASLAMCVYAITAESKPAELLESYTYTIKHGGNGSPELSTSFTGASPLNCSPQNVKAQAIQLIRSLVSITNNLDPLPRNRMITMKVFFNESCPEGWQPKHFQKAPSTYRDHDPSTSLKLAVGRVVTPHHFVTMEAETAEECLETLSQAKPTYDASRSHSKPEQESNGAQMDEENPVSVISDDESNQPRLVGNALAQSPKESEAELVPVEPHSNSLTKLDFLSFIVLSERIGKQSIEKRFSTCPLTLVRKWMEEAQQAGVLRKSSKRNVFEVAVHDSDILYGAINEMHGKLKRQMTTDGLATTMDIDTHLAEALLVRMEQEKLVRRTEDPQHFDVLFSESNRALVKKAIQRAKEQQVRSKSVPVSAGGPDSASGSDVYEFEPTTFVTPTGSKRKAQPSTAKTSASSKQSCGAHQSSSPDTCMSASSGEKTAATSSCCANVPIVQVKRALKKRKLIVKSVG